MASSSTQSGYPIILKYGDPLIERLVVSGVSIAPGVRRGDVHTIMGWVAKQFNDTVEKLIAGQCWGYAPRKIRGGSGWSNHYGAVAIDLNTARFPQGTRHMSNAQVAACRAIVKASNGVIRWGGDYTGTTKVDQQHFEINDNMAFTVKLATLARTVSAKLMPKPVPMEDDEMKATDKIELRDAYISSSTVSADRSMTVEDAIKTGFNYGSVAARDTKVLKEQVVKLQKDIATLKAAIKNG